MIAAAGYLLGGMGWLVLLGWALDDWILFWATLIGAAVILAQAICRIRRTLQNYHSTMVQTIILMLIYALAAFNWHWDAWRALLLRRTGIEFAFTMYGRIGWNTVIIALYLFLWQRLHWSHKRTRN